MSTLGNLPIKKFSCDSVSIKQANQLFTSEVTKKKLEQYFGAYTILKFINCRRKMHADVMAVWTFLFIFKIKR